jgi:hypothetical protein
MGFDVLLFAFFEDESEDFTKGEVWELATLSFLDSLALGALITRRVIVGCQFPDAASYRKNDSDMFRSHSGT